MTDEQILALVKASHSVHFYIHGTTKQQAEDFANQVGNAKLIWGINGYYYFARGSKFVAVCGVEKKEDES